MRAVIYDRFEGPLELRDVADPSPPRDGVVIGVRASGLCRSDWHGWRGHDADVRLPHVPGHEFAGTILAVGTEVVSWSEGDRVTVPFSVGCGRCAPCRSGNHQVCDAYFQPGFTAWGSFAEQVAIPHAEENLVRLPDQIDFRAAASLGCRFVTAYRAVVAQGQLQPDQWLVVFGCGGVGLSAIMIAAALGARVIGVDIQPDALQLASSLGAAHVINGNHDDTLPRIRDLTNGGSHLSVDALGSPATCALSIRSLRKQGRHVQIGLMTGADRERLSFPMDEVIARELHVVGSHGMSAKDYPTMMEMIIAGTLQPQKLITRTVSLDRIVDLLPRVDKNRHFGVTVAEIR